MNAQRLLSAEAVVALTGVVTSDLIAQSKDPARRGLPPPRRILAIFLFYGSLSLISAFGAGPARFAAAAGAVTALASLVIGTTGSKIVDLLNSGASWLAPTTTTATPASGGGPV